jgi:hypothetical protein
MVTENKGLASSTYIGRLSKIVLFCTRQRLFKARSRSPHFLERLSYPISLSGSLPRQRGKMQRNVIVLSRAEEEGDLFGTPTYLQYPSLPTARKHLIYYYSADLLSRRSSGPNAVRFAKPLAWDYQLAIASDHGTTKSRDKEKQGSIKKVFEITSISCTPEPRDQKMVAQVAIFGGAKVDASYYSPPDALVIISVLLLL